MSADNSYYNFKSEHSDIKQNSQMHWANQSPRQLPLDYKYQEIEKSIKFQKKIELKKQLEQQRNQSLQLKQSQILQEKEEAHTLNQQNKLIYDQLQSQFCQDKFKYQKEIAQSHVQQHLQKEINKRYEILQKKIQENELIHNIQDQIENEQVLQSKLRSELKESKEKDYQQKINQLSQQKILKQQEQQSYIQQCDQNNLREQTKEFLYQNYYEKIAKQQAINQNINFQKAIIPEQERLRKLDDFIQKNIKETQFQQQIMDERNYYTQQKKILNNDAVNQSLSHKRQAINDFQKNVENQRKFHQRIKDVQVENSLDDLRKQIENQQKNYYKNQLQDQLNWKKRIDSEKKQSNQQEINYLNNIFQDPSKGYVVPGWNLQIGAQQPRPLINDWKKYRAKQIENQLQHPSIQKSRSYADQLTSKSVNFDENIKKNQNYYMFGHNPIVNPLPYNIQNPYICKEYSKTKNCS